MEHHQQDNEYLLMHGQVERLTVVLIQQPQQSVQREYTHLQLPMQTMDVPIQIR